MPHAFCDMTGSGIIDLDIDGLGPDDENAVINHLEHIIMFIQGISKYSVSGGMNHVSEDEDDICLEGDINIKNLSVKDRFIIVKAVDKYFQVPENKQPQLKRIFTYMLNIRDVIFRDINDVIYLVMMVDAKILMAYNFTPSQIMVDAINQILEQIGLKETYKCDIKYDGKSLYYSFETNIATEIIQLPVIFTNYSNSNYANVMIVQIYRMIRSIYSKVIGVPNICDTTKMPELMSYCDMYEIQHGYLIANKICNRC